MTIAFIGIGVMGLPMAQNLLRGGHSLRVYTRTAEKAAPLVAQGALQCKDIKSCVSGCGAVITMVSYPADVEDVYLKKGGILEEAPPRALLIDMTTTSPALWQRIAGMARGKGFRPLDAPVSGGDTGARNATLAVMAGGEEEDFKAALPLFNCMGKTIVHEGPDGFGQHTKMANQIAIAGAISGVAEALRYGESKGLDAGKMLATISSGAAGSWQMSNNGPKMAGGDMRPGFFIKHFVKDLRIAQGESEAGGLLLPVLREALTVYTALEEAGLGEQGTQALIQAYRKA
jgi:3-hydroxyisobutyrate dehydrogenase-like beta-hydroxyacid dehydrogenase